MKKKEKMTNNAPQLLAPRLPLTIIITGMLVWTYLVLSRYYAANPFQSDVFPAYFSSAAWGVPVGLPQVLHLLTRVILAVAPALLIVFAGFSAGRWILPLFRLQGVTALESFLLSVSLGCGAVALGVFSLGMLGVLYPVAVWGMIGLLDAAGIGALIRARGREKGAAPAALLKKLSGFEKLWAVIALFFCVIVMLGVAAPETFYDSMVYHLAKPNFWIQNHRILPDEAKLITGFFPGNVNCLYVPALMAGPGGSAAKAVSFLCMFLAVGVVYAMGRRFSGRGAGILAAVLYLTVPYIGIVSYRSAMEMPLAFFETLAVFSLVVWMNGEDRKWLLLAGINCGLALGTKYTALYCLVGLTGALVLDSLLAKRPVMTMLRSAALLMGVALAVSLPWWLYNAWHTGNPLYPFFTKYIGYVHPRMTDDPALRIASVSRWKQAGEILAGPWKISMGGYEEAFIGPAILLFIPLFFVMKNRWRPAKSLFLYVAAYWVIWGVAHEMYVRYYLPALATVCFLCGFYFYENVWPKMIRSAVFLALTAVMVGNVAFVMAIQKNALNCLGVDLGLESEADYVARQRMTYPNPYHAAALWIDGHLPRNSYIAMMGELRTLYIDRKTIMSDPANTVPVVAWAEEARDGEELYAKLRQKGVTHLLLNVPESHRLASLDLLNFEPKGLRNFGQFWKRHVRQVHSSIADLEIASRGIRSMKLQVPEWWREYASNQYNYVYVYEIVPEKTNAGGSSVPYNFFMTPYLYPDKRWKGLEGVAGEYWQQTSSPRPAMPS